MTVTCEISKFRALYGEEQFKWRSGATPHSMMPATKAKSCAMLSAAPIIASALVRQRLAYDFVSVPIHRFTSHPRKNFRSYKASAVSDDDVGAELLIFSLVLGRLDHSYRIGRTRG